MRSAGGEPEEDADECGDERTDRSRAAEATCGGHPSVSIQTCMHYLEAQCGWGGLGGQCMLAHGGDDELVVI